MNSYKLAAEGSTDPAGNQQQPDKDNTSPKDDDHNNKETQQQQQDDKKTTVKTSKIKDSSTNDSLMASNKPTPPKLTISEPAAASSAANASSNSLATQTTTLKSEVAPGRKKVLLGKGYSLMDWIRLTRETPDLAGTKGVHRDITYEELARHNTEKDCWLALNDKVYNVTPYLKFHPGGVDEIMRGAGIDATYLFNEVHPWVNVQSMLDKVLVGTLVGSPPAAKKAMTPPEGPAPYAEAAAKAEASTPTTPTSTEPPVVDSSQTNEAVTVEFHTNCKHMKSEYMIVEKPPNSSSLVVFLYLNGTHAVFKYTFDMPAPTRDDYQIKASADGKIELVLKKLEQIHWWQMCPKLTFQVETVRGVQAGVNFRECVLKHKKNVTHDTDIYYFELPTSCRMCTPLGYHVYLKCLDDEIAVAPYTVIYSSLQSRTNEEINGRHVCLMIKHYKDGILTPKLQQLTIGSKVLISNYTGYFLAERFETCRELVLLCAGTGFTPMIRLLYYAFQDMLITRKQVTMLFFNKSLKDILWRKELDELKKQYPTRFELVHILSSPDAEWKGHKGRIRRELLDELMPKNLKDPLICICGPTLFTEAANDLLKAMKYNTDSIHLFLS